MALGRRLPQKSAGVVARKALPATAAKPCTQWIIQHARGKSDRTPARGQPNSRRVFPNSKGGGTIRDYGPDGRAKTDYDFGHDHGAGDPHALELAEP